MEWDTYELDKETLRNLYQLFKAVDSADAIYKPCQDKAFRQYIKDTMKAANIQKAFHSIGRMIGEEHNI